ncbi:hypothetical protein GCM10010185_65090 [Saccharothrix coeruleofusca]|uniref:DUF6875 domain-containing protein n=1 Tax=Saccharothrix coeruleofusca TaxID=33919 RepID=A0A918AVS2_9PSEU|nr:hypothetical protein GCM10010185_65090 [Saccharothrix coeruleofusca]
MERRPVLPATVDRDIRQVLDWLDDFISAPHPDLGRSGDVCPFVRASRLRRELFLALRYDVDGDSGEELGRVVREEVERFTARFPLPPSARGPVTTSQVVAFPAIPDRRWEVIDQSYPALKEELVAEGLMIGQFHPTCPEPAVRNRDFPVSRSPLPMYALRWMAVHDILFLRGRRTWFERYRSRFGALHDNGRVADPLLRRYYEEALRAYG